MPEVRRRWPAFGRGTAVTDDVMAIYSPSTGIVAADQATATLHRLAVEHGAALRPHTPVRELRSVGGEVDVVTDSGAVRCGAVVVCADAWTNRLLDVLGHHIELAVTREQVTYFATDDLDDLRPGTLPGVDLDGRPELLRVPGVRHGGNVQGRRGLWGAGGRSGHRTFEPDPAMEARLGAFVSRLVGDRRPTARTDDVPLHADRRS